MAREKFEDRILSGPIKVACKFDDGSVRYWDTTKEEVVEHIVDIVNDYSSQGYILTLRQLHYQLVKSNWIVNHDTAYKKLGSILDDCRYGGIIDWDAIEDRGRVPWIPYSVNGVDEALKDTIDQFRINRQDEQENVVELWTEKDALSGILRRTTAKYHVKLVVNKGYTSSSAIYNAYERVIEAFKNDQKFVILYFGDHDPSGLDMVRDIKERLILFLSQGRKIHKLNDFEEKLQNWWDAKGYNVYTMVDDGHISQKCGEKLMGGEAHYKYYDEWDYARIKLYLDERDMFKVIPIGLTMEQIKKYSLPPNPTKITDSRADKYIKKFGKTCWEVDALNPKTLTEIVELNIQRNIDINVFNKQIKREKKDLETLKKLLKK
jgi:hypothetical protein